MGKLVTGDWELINKDGLENMPVKGTTFIMQSFSVSNTVLGVEETAVNKTNSLPMRGLRFSWGRKQTYKKMTK